MVFYGSADENIPLNVIVFSSLACFLLCILIIYLSKFFSNRRAYLDTTAIQSAHSGIVPRIGGLAIYSTLIVVILLLQILDIAGFKLGYLVWSAAPVFIIGIAEDLGFSMNPYRRLTASIVSGVLILIVSNVWITSVSIPFIDLFLKLAPVGILFTLFATTGVVNSFNLIDGLNGLSSYVAISTALSIGLIAKGVGFNELENLMIFLAAIILGFLFLNFPSGKIFLGDAGAYVLGHVLVWASIILVNFDNNLSPFSILLIFFWPIADTLLAIWRRWYLGYRTDRPDKLHFHHLAMRCIEIKIVGRGRRKLSNPMANLVLIPFIYLPQILGVVFVKDIGLTIWFTIGMGLLFLTSYTGGIFISKKGFTKENRICM